jgi:hypothetical protein
MKSDRKNILVLLLLFTAFAVQIARHANNFYVPESDFFDYKEKAVQLSNFDYPENFKRPPLFPVAIAVFAVPFSGPYQELYAAELIVALSALFSLLFIYRISFRFLGKHALWIAWVFAMHPTTLRMAIKPKPEMFVTVFILWAIDRFLGGDRKAYLIAFLATMVRYEGALVIVAFFVVDFIFNKARIKSLFYSFLAGLPLVLWTLLHSEGSDGGSYGNYFNSYSLNISYLESLWRGLLAFLPYQYFNVWFILAFSLFIFGVVWGLKKYRSHTIVLLVFIAGFVAMHTIWPFNNVDYLVIVGWSLFAFIGLGAVTFAKFILNRINFNERIVLAVSLNFLAIVVFLTATHKFQYEQFYPNALVMLSFLVSAATFLYFLKQTSPKFNWNYYPLGLAVLILLAFWLNSKNNGDFFDIHYSKAEFRKAGEWFEENFQQGDKMAIAQPTVVSYFTKLDKEKDFLRITEIPNDEPGQINSWLKEQNVTYITWLSTNKVEQDVNAWESWKRDNRGWTLIKFLEKGNDLEGFEMVHEIKIGPRWGYIYKVL